jgi:hypothetical protein
MPVLLSFDRFEGRDQSIAILLTDDGEVVQVPRSLLPRGTKPGDVLSLTLERDAEATAELLRRTRAVQDELAGTDPGGDLAL